MINIHRTLTFCLQITFLAHMQNSHQLHRLGIIIIATLQLRKMKFIKVENRQEDGTRQKIAE